MERFDFRQFLLKTSPREIRIFDNEISELAKKGRYREAVNHFFNHVPVFAPGMFDELYFREELTYLRALLYTAIGDRASALAQIKALNVDSAGDASNLFFLEHLNNSKMIKEHQARAIASQKPGILITALPKSASAFLSRAIADILDAPLVRASMGEFPEMAIVPRWVGQVARGGCVTHDHFDASPSNLTAIAASGIQHIFVQLRDPRAALWSYVHHDRRMSSKPAASRSLEELIDLFYRPAIAWIASWLAATSFLGGKVQVYFTDYQAVTETTQAVIEAIFQLSHAEHLVPEVSVFLSRRSNQYVPSVNFRSGRAEEWREHIPPSLQRRLWELLPIVLRERMKLKP